MCKRIEYYHRQKLGELCFIKNVQNVKREGGRSDRAAIFQCNCGKYFATLIHNAKSGMVKSCGCLNENDHGMSDHLLYQRWATMKDRCYNPDGDNYENYMYRGISVCDEWRNNFKAYFDYVMSLDNAMGLGLTVDRIDNDGNYELGNLRWADKHTQAVNRRKPKNNTSGILGVYFHKQSGKWYSRISIRGKRINFGYFYTLIDASKARNEYIEVNNLTEYQKLM